MIAFYNLLMYNVNMLEAKCPLCEKRARVLDDMSRVVCDCGYEDEYDAYLEKMKDRVYSIVEEFVLNEQDKI